MTSETEPLLCLEERQKVAAPAVDPDERTRVWNAYTVRTRALIIGLVFVSVVLNVVALLPSSILFVFDGTPSAMDSFIRFGNYNFGHSIELLHETGLDGYVTLIVIWTCVVPPLKIFVTLYSSLTLQTHKCRFLSHAIVGHIARFALLDIYFCVLLIMLTSNQDHEISVLIVSVRVNLSVTPKAAIFIYHFAILLSMAAGEVVEQLDHRHKPPAIAVKGGAERPPTYFPVFAAAPGWAAASFFFSLTRLVLCALTLALPLFTVGEVSQLPQDLRSILGSLHVDLLLHNEWTLAGAIAALLGSGDGFRIFFGIDALVFLMITPITSAAVALYCALAPCGSAPVLALRWMHGLARFANLEVLLFAILIYLSEQGQLIQIQLGAAWPCLVVYVFALIGSLVCTTRAVRNTERREAEPSKVL